MMLKDNDDVCVESGLHDYLCETLRDSLPRIGVSPGTIEELLSFDIENQEEMRVFREKHTAELQQAYWGTFQTEHVPLLYTEYVLSHVSQTGTWLDIGCGRGTLLNQRVGSKTLRRVGVDIAAHESWKDVRGVEFYEIAREDLTAVIDDIQPSFVTMVWTLHHMGSEEQEQCFAALNKLPAKSKIVLLEDAYSETQKPMHGAAWHRQFMRLSVPSRQRAIHLLDYIANRVLSGDDRMPIPGTYRTLEQWGELSRKHSHTPVLGTYLGFPQHRDVHTPQSLLVLERTL